MLGILSGWISGVLSVITRVATRRWRKSPVTISMVIRPFDHPFFKNHFGPLVPYTGKIGLPNHESNKLYYELINLSNIKL